MVGQSKVTISLHPQDQWSLSGPPVIQVLSSSQLALCLGMPVPNLCFHSVPESSPDLDGTLDADPCRPPGPSLMGRLLIWTCTPCLCSGAHPDPTGLRGTLHLTRSPCPSPVISGSHRRASSSTKGMFNSSMFRKTLLEALWRVDHEVGPVDLCLGLRSQGLCKADRLISLLWSPSFDTESLF